MENERNLMESLAKKDRAFKQFERQKQTTQKETKVQNKEKSAKTAQIFADENRKQEQLVREMKRKEKKVQSKLEEGE